MPKSLKIGFRWPYLVFVWLHVCDIESYLALVYLYGNFVKNTLGKQINQALSGMTRCTVAQQYNGTKEIGITKYNDVHMDVSELKLTNSNTKIVSFSIIIICRIERNCKYFVKIIGSRSEYNYYRKNYKQFVSRTLYIAVPELSPRGISQNSKNEHIF